MISKKILLLFIAVQFYGYLFSQTTLTLLNSYNIGSVVAEPSGLAFDKMNNQLFVVSDFGNIYRLSITGNLLETYIYPGDLEGVSMYNAPNIILVAIEDLHQLFEFNFVTSTTIASHTMSYTNMGNSGSGIEGVTYNPTTGEIYFLNEKKPGALIVANSNFTVTDEYVLTFAGDYSASYYVEETGLLWLGSDNSSTIYKCTTNGTVIETFPLSLDKLEGIAIDYENQILYAVTDAGQQLLVYSIYDPAFSVNETEINNNAIIVFPNPANETITIKFNNFEIVENIKIYNEFGQVVKTLDGDMETFYIDDLSPGMYFITITNTKGSFVEKFIKK